MFRDGSRIGDGRGAIVGEVVPVSGRSGNNFAWTIPNCCFYTNRNYRSPNFNVKFNDVECTWNLQLVNTDLAVYLDNYQLRSPGTSKPNENWISYFQSLLFSNSSEELEAVEAERSAECSAERKELNLLHVDFKFAILDSDGLLTHTYETDDTFHKTHKCMIIERYVANERKYAWDWSPLIATENRTIIVEITYTPQIKQSSPCNQELSLSDELKQCFLNEKPSDLTILVNDKEIHVHKDILESRSPAFLAVLTKNILNDCVQIYDLDFQTMRHILLFIYKRCVERRTDLAMKLLRVADVYAVKGLKDACTDILRSKLTVENAINTLRTADFYGNETLRREVLAFVSRNKHEVRQTEDYKWYCRDD